ncbi:MAG: M1 family metallopeptidase [Saprospiraceae bacterium]|nr:M1 family metallopeptidase [Saprospiraceae bacterium]
MSILLVLSISFLFGQRKTVTYYDDPSSAYEEKVIEVNHLSAFIEIDPYTRSVKGKAVFSFTPLRSEIDSLIFYITDITVSEAVLNNSSVKFKKSGDILIIYPENEQITDKTNKISLKYSASNPKYLYLTGWDDPKGLMRKEIWAHRPNSWLPYITARITVDLHVTFDSRYNVFSNGIRDSVTINNDYTKTWHYSMPAPHPFFSTALVIGDYKWKSSRTKSGIPLEYWYYPDQEDRVETTYKYTENMFDFFEQELGCPYPWVLYREAPVADYLYGAMETTTSTIFGDYMFVDDRAWWMRNYVNVNAHELAHQWFGNYITHVPHSDVWLTESFATYYAKLFEKNMYGEDFYQKDRNNEMLKAYELSVQNSYPLGSGMAGTQRIYQKGSLVLDMLRDVMGDDNFRKAVTHYLKKFPYTDAESKDFERAIWESTGMSLPWFFDQWLNRGGEPEYTISYKTISNSVNINIKQTHKIDSLVKLFKMQVVIDIYHTDGTKKSLKRWIEDQNTDIAVENQDNKSVAFIIFDPGKRIFKTTKFDRTYKELIAQAKYAENMIDRYDALMVLRESNDKDKLKDMSEIYHNEKFHLNKSEIIFQLKDTIKAIQLFKEAINDGDALVRRAVANNILKVPLSLQKDYVQLLNDQDYYIVEKSLENLCTSFPKNTEKYLKATSSETGWRGKNIRIKWLEIAIKNNKKKHLEELKDYSSVSYEFETRKNALEALARLDYLDSTVAFNLLKAYSYWNFKLSDPANKILTEYKTKPEKWNLIDDAYKIGKWRVEEKIKLDKLFE